MNIGTWFKSATNKVKSYFLPADQQVIQFFTPLMNQVKEQALILGKDNLAIGLKILKDAAIAGALAGVSAPPGAKVLAAEAAFLRVGVTGGITAIHNAEAATIKAAVAIIQTAAPQVVGALAMAAMNVPTVTIPVTKV